MTTTAYPRLEVRPLGDGRFGVYVVFSNGAAVRVAAAATRVAAEKIADHYAIDGGTR